MPGYRAEIVRLPVERRRVLASGTILSSLFEAGASARVSERVVMKIADIFTWDIDFVRGINEGDSFAVVYEELWRDGQKLGEGDVLAAEFVNRGRRYTAVRFADSQGKPGYYTADGRPMRKAFVRAPVPLPGSVPGSTRAAATPSSTPSARTRASITPPLPAPPSSQRATPRSSSAAGGVATATR
jgi:hypothetical protein